MYGRWIFKVTPLCKFRKNHDRGVASIEAGEAVASSVFADL